MRITLDTNVLPAEKLIHDVGPGFDFAAVSVTSREVAGTSLEVCLKPLTVVPETGVFDESTWDDCVWAGDDDPLERLLSIVAGGSFPKVGSRGTLTKGQRNQLRDAMVLAAHLRERREVFVTNDAKGFIKNGRREALEKEFATRVMTQAEFREFVISQDRKAT